MLTSSYSPYRYIVTMAILDILENLNVVSLALGIPALVVLGHVLNWLIDRHNIRQYPGPFFAKFTDLWLGRVAANGHRSEVVHELHKQHGTSLYFISSSLVD